MGRGKSQRQKLLDKKAKKQQQQQQQCNDNVMSSWVDRLEFVPITCTSSVGNGGLTLSLISWNVLAESYCSRKSHRGLPESYQQVVFDPYQRGSLIRQVLAAKPTLRPDVWALQEVDLDEIMTQHLGSVGYEGVETPRMKLGAGAGGKVDSCGLYYLSKKWTLLDQQLIRLDDLASLPATERQNGNDTGIGSINNNLRGLQNSFLRRNVALLVRLQSKTHPGVTIVVAVAHLFWNPLYEYVKLCQTHYIMLKAKEFLKSDEEPFILCGDFNSMPGTSVHTYLSQGVVNAKTVAPWYKKYQSPWKQKENGNKVDTSNNNASAVQVNGLSKELSNLNLSPSNPQLPEQQKHQIRYLLDYNLNRLCRWFRILGLDAGLETEQEEHARTKLGQIQIFDRCRQEGRVLITTSNSLLARTNCPPGTYLINPKSLSNNWEIVLVHILLTHGVHLNPHTFLTRCVVCNGNICSVHDPALKQTIFDTHQAPIDSMDGADTLDVFQCDGCQQGYWWCDRPTSSASRVKGQATRLYQMCLRAQVPITAPTNKKHMFEHVHPQDERAQGWDWTIQGSELLRLRLEVAEWLKNVQLACPIANLESAYQSSNNGSGPESLPYTNVTSDFEGCLDYIFFQSQSFVPTEQLYVPRTHEELNHANLAGGHLLPSNVWPSDHLAIGATLQLRSGGKK